MRQHWSWLASLAFVSPLAALGCTAIIGEGTSTQGQTDNGTDTVTSGLPCDVAELLQNRCLSCHGTPPLPGLEISLVSYDALLAPSATNPGESVAQLALSRMQDAAKPMPPSGALDGNEISVFQAWLQAGAEQGTCDANPPPSIYDTPLQCSSDRYWTHGNEESPNMRPGGACISCHAKEGEGPRFGFAGTVYPSAHEPNDCFGLPSDASGAQVVLTGADGQTLTLDVRSSGNFYSKQHLALPYSATLSYQGRERSMATPQQSGDCNKCHTEDGAEHAPGRVMLP